ncbi:hypothetical protein ARMGADRAFT_239135 [Armillaria gallica]|uniref:Uncharacterized protein n=1 Tax=Armillaria gallica TaxID=47427 RepID=A0A2H3E3R6_ARMGA|nr:hypothetical protein ARMGADRAFT_239135 [Armillaria gallica]
MSPSLDTDMRAAVHCTLGPTLIQHVEQNVSKEVLSLTVSQFAELYPTLQQSVPAEDLRYPFGAANIFAQLIGANPRSDLAQLLRIVWAKFLVNEEADTLSQGELHLDIYTRF